MCAAVERDQSADMENTVEQVRKIIGEPRNYGEHIILMRKLCMLQMCINILLFN